MIPKTTNPSRVAIFSDLHLGTHQNSIFWHNIALNWTDWFVAKLKNQNIDTVLFLGDFFDHRDEIAVNTLDIGYKILTKFQDIKLIMIPGNHDSFYKEHSEINSLNIFNGWKNVQLINDISSLDFGNTAATFVPWGGDISKVQWTPYLFGHFEINSFRMNSAKVCDKGTDIEKFFALSPQIFSGHFHLRDSRVYDNNSITYVGNVFEINFGEINNAKGYHILNFDDNKEAPLFIENTVSPKHLKISMSDIVKYSNIPADKAALIKGNIIRLIVDKVVSADIVDAVQAKIKSYEPAQSTVEFLLNSNIVNIDEAVRSSDLSDVNVEKAIGEFVSFLEVDNKDKISECCIDFYNKCK
jgi:DNA repair exonuclease SbcCD nuclease subunit